MAALMVGGSFLSGFLNVLFDRMTSPVVLNFLKGSKLKVSLLTKLKMLLNSVNRVLDDAEEKQSSWPTVREWLDDLRVAVFEADDLLDEVAYEALRMKVENGSTTPMGIDQVRSNTLSSHNPLKLGKDEIEEKLEEIVERLEYLVQQRDFLGLGEGIAKNPSSKKLPTTSLVDDLGVYGRDADKETIVELLLANDGHGNNNIGVITIVGMAGIGKTTLAQLVYNDKRVLESFDVKAWVFVSEDFHVLKVTNDILSEVGVVISNISTPNQLQLKLQGQLAGKRFLLVLDDVWNESYPDWDFLVKPLKSAALGSKIVITTRNESVAAVMRTVPSHYLKELTDDDCWILFSKHAFDDGYSSSAHSDLEVIGKKIAKRCKGSPLAAKALGGLLRSKRDVKDWEKILTSNMWDLRNDNILPALRLSYCYLPSGLKQCFAYCAIFPKGKVFRKERLVRLWVAEGFLSPGKGNRDMEALGEEYFDDLVSRSFFQQRIGDRSCFLMHDLINDLAKFVSGEFCFRMENHNSHMISKKTRHLSYGRTKRDATIDFKGIHEAQFLRTFMHTQLSAWWSDNPIDSHVLCDLLPALKRLRVLSLTRCRKIAELPDSIGSCKHLRYLNLYQSSIAKLPESVSKLYNLQILFLSGCQGLISLPDSIGSLKNLRYVDLSRTSIQRLPESMRNLHDLHTLLLYKCESLIELLCNVEGLTNLCHLNVRGTKLLQMPLQMGRLIELQTLTDFVLGEQGGSSITELRGLQLLQGTLRIANLQNVAHHRDALEANLKAKKCLERLELIWDGSAHDSAHERSVLEELQPHVNMKDLAIFHYGGTRFPDWIGDSSFSSMVSLTFRNCKYCSSLPTLGGLPSLKDLSIVAFEGLVTVGSEFYGRCTSLMKAFRSLEVLRFEEMPNWHEWIPCDYEAFPLLQELYIINCPDLSNALPDSLPSLTTLRIQGCQQLSISFPAAPLIHEMVLDDHFSSRVSFSKRTSGQHSVKVSKLAGKHTLNSILKGIEQMVCMSSSLEKISVKSCESLKCFPLELLPILKILEIRECPNLESLFVPEATSRDFTALNFLIIEDCHNFVSFPEGGLPAPNLRRFMLLRCSKLKSLPERMHSLLPSLVDLVLDRCPELESFPENGLPSKLEAVRIFRCKKLTACYSQWNLQVLLFLSHLTFGGYGDMEVFPGNMLLPCSLTFLKIRDLQKLISFNQEGIRQLTSLTKLEILDCPRLQSLPKEGLPSSLSYLSISNCPVLKQRCEHERGEDWPKICNISCIKIE